MNPTIPVLRMPRQKKPSARRIATKRNGDADKLEAVPEERKSQVANKQGLGDIKVLHTGKGCASEIHVYPRN